MKSLQSFFLVILALIFGGIYHSLQPSKSVVFKGLSADHIVPEFKLFIRSKGEKPNIDGAYIQFNPPYEFVLRIMPEDERAVFVELQDVQVFACGDYKRLLSYEEPLIYTVDYFDYKKPMALYQLRGDIECHEKVIMDITFVIRDASKGALHVGEERVLIETYEYTPSTLRYWWEMAKGW